MKFNVKDEIVVFRYAEAFVGYAQKTIGFEAALSALRDFKDLIRQTPDVLEFFKSMVITVAEKYQFIDQVLVRIFPLELCHFLKLLIEKKRICLIEDIIEYTREKYSYSGQVDVVVKTTFPIEEHELTLIKEKLENKLQKKVKFYLDWDGNLLGGMKLFIGNKVIDGSIKRRLADLKEELLTIRV